MRGMITYGLMTTSLLAITCCTQSQPGVLPLGNLETKPGPSITGVASLAGWTAAEDGVKKVCLYVDRQPATCTESITGVRPDVAKVYPRISGAATSGWSIQFDSSSLSSGDHELLVQATTKSGATRDIGAVNVTVAK